VSWLLGAALLGAVVAVALHFSEGREFAHLLERAEPSWLVLAVLLQAATYLAQSEVFQVAPRAAGFPLPRRWLYGLSLTKLSLDQAVPSAGIGSTVVVAKALELRGIPREVVAAGAVINIASFHSAYVVALGVALGIASALGQASLPLVLASAVFVAFSLAVIVTGLVLSGRPAGKAAGRARLPLLRGVVGFLEGAEARLSRSPKLLAEATAWQLAVFLLDALTMWVLLRSLGVAPPVGGVFTSFMISSLFRTVGPVPGGLGTYEATSVVTLHVIGVGIETALAATLMFRALSFWLPMLPGLWFSRRVTARRGFVDPRPPSP